MRAAEQSPQVMAAGLSGWKAFSAIPLKVFHTTFIALLKTASQVSEKQNRPVDKYVFIASESLPAGQPRCLLDLLHAILLSSL